MTKFRSEVEDAAKKAFQSMGVEYSFEIETPSYDIADLAIPCFSLAKTLRKSPTSIAEEAVTNLPKMELISEAWAKNGYLNFKLDAAKLATITLRTVLNEASDYGCGQKKSVKVLLEHTSVNPTGPIHVGRARNPIIGDTLARCMKACGYDVTTEYLVNDVGKQVVLLAWGLKNIDPSEVDIADRDKADHQLVPFYRKANQMMEEDQEVARQISELLVRFEAGDAEVIDSVRKTASMMLDGIVESLDMINVHIDNFTWESDFIKDGSARQVVDELSKCAVCREEEGAMYLDLEGCGIHGRGTKFFFTRADGTTLYTTRDIAYHLDKFERADRIINILGEDQKLGQAQLANALMFLGKDRAPECIFYSFVSLPEGRMSTRKGVVVYLDDLIEEAEERAMEEVRKRRDDLSEEKMKEIARDLGRGAVRYNIVRVQPEKQLTFKWDEALNFEGNSAPFVQYAHARACSILRRAGDFDHLTDLSVLKNDYEVRLIKELAKFPSIIEDAGEKARIHLLPVYCHDVASAFNQFYTYMPVIKGGDMKDARLILVDATRIVLANALNTLGLIAPEEM
ncbi:MAG: arginine--tRNA ligase [Euryarchaeota archaeon]|nr:arginine--tRNA ligase [Euryarchaeota archaeon]